MKNAIMQPPRTDILLRIEGAHIELPQAQTFSAWTFDRAISRAKFNKTADPIRTWQIITHKPLWVIGQKPSLRIWRDIANQHPSKHHYYDKLRDYYTASNDTWREMDKPRYMRGIDDSGLW